MTAGSMSQGQTNWYTYTVPSGTPSLTVDLNWGNPANSLALTVIAPDGTIGPYYDTSGTGRITLLIKKTGTLAPGTWNIKVYGDHVTGLQRYNLQTY